MGSPFQFYAQQARALLMGQPVHAAPRRIDRWRVQAEEGWYQLRQALDQANPLNLVLGLVVAYLVYKLLRPFSIRQLTPTLAEARSVKRDAHTAYSSLPPHHPPTTVWKRYTPRTLAVHDGSGMGQGGALSKGKTSQDGGERILLAIEGKVFDVTKGANFYGPGGPYGNFAGRDASRGMAKQSFDLEMLTPLDQPIDSLTDLTPMEVGNMREWVAHFTAKYTVVGELVNEGEQGDD